MTERHQGQEQAQANRLIGQDVMAWFRQGLAELREVFNPSRESIAQPVQYGAIGQPPPSTVARALSTQEQGYSLDQLKDRGREILRDQQQDQHRDHGNEHDR